MKSLLSATPRMNGPLLMTAAPTFLADLNGSNP